MAFVTNPQHITAVLLPVGRWHLVVEQSFRVKDGEFTFESETHGWLSGPGISIHAFSHENPA
jgi:hypothetical protein